ncbi:MAG: superoxide dismutase [Opitutus sp.]|nr:superoxide dismutase [Opitutus sp.]
MNNVTRRQVFKSAGLLTAGFFLSTSTTRALAQAAAPAPTGPHKLPALPYDFGALEPHFDAKTMEIHHGKHHAAYVTNLNKALADYPDLQKMSVEELCLNLDKVPEKIRTTVRNQGGGHYNHTFFWQCLRPEGGAGPDGAFEQALGELFVDQETGLKMFVERALAVFGSGWIWVSLDKDKRLILETTANQDNPLMSGRQPVFGLDLWEHAYYLKYQNRRVDYVIAFNRLLNWEFARTRWEKLMA